jgi:nucleoside-diphosphate-sugar epimerase
VFIFIEAAMLVSLLAVALIGPRTPNLNQEELTVFGDGRQTLSFCYASDLIERHFPAWTERL